MAAVPLTHQFLEDQWRSSGRRYFHFIHTLQNYNDSPNWIGFPTMLKEQALDCAITITNIEIVHAGTIGVVINPIFISTSGDGGLDNSMYLEAHTTALATDVHWIDPNLIINNRTAVIGSQWLTAYFAGYVAADDLMIIVRGYIESTPKAGPPQAVSLEGYKWPLQRR